MNTKASQTRKNFPKVFTPASVELNTRYSATIACDLWGTIVVNGDLPANYKNEDMEDEIRILILNDISEKLGPIMNGAGTSVRLDHVTTHEHAFGGATVISYRGTALRHVSGNFESH